MDSIDDVVLMAEDKMSKCVEHLGNEFAGLRTGKASPALVENIDVSYYGSQTRLRELANISTPEPRLIVITAYDPSSLPDIEKAIAAANVGVTPLNDGRVIRVPIPELSEERRGEIIKVAKHVSEDSRVAVRNVRREANDAIKAMEKDGKITEDDKDMGRKEVQKSTDDYMKKIEEMLSAKEEELMEV